MLKLILIIRQFESGQSSVKLTGGATPAQYREIIEAAAARWSRIAREAGFGKIR